VLKLLGIAAAVVVLAAIGLVAYASTLPDETRIQRTASIAAPPEKIFPLINNLRTLNTWNPFALKDPNAKATYSGPESGVGALHAWNGNSEVGEGTIEITGSTPSSEVLMKLHMVRPMDVENRVQFTLQPRGDRTDVTWAMDARAPLIGKVMCLFFNMDKMVGGEFERGLTSLKALAER
jgi:hypothetical protein